MIILQWASFSNRFKCLQNGDTELKISKRRPKKIEIFQDIHFLEAEILSDLTELEVNFMKPRMVH